MIVSSQIEAIRARLFDSKVLWSDQELLDWWNSGYIDFLGRSSAVRRFIIDDVPGRVAYAHTQDWEETYLTGKRYKCTGTIWDGTRQGTTNWEAEFVEGIQTTISRAGICQPWERCFSGDTDAPFSFVVPREHDNTSRVSWDDRLLVPVAVKQLDWLRGWEREPGMPIVWTSGKGNVLSFEVFEIRTDYQQAYELDFANQGVPRVVAGTRTYTQSTSTPLDSTWAYSTEADRQAIASANGVFAPTSATTNDAELPFAFGAGPYRFTMKASTDSRDAQGLGANFYGTQPWEIGNRTSGRTLGTQYFELLFGAVLGQTGGGRPIIQNARGPGFLFTTQAATLGYWGVNPWETSIVDGGAGTVAGVKNGTYTWESAFGATESRPFLGTVRGGWSNDRQYLPIPEGSIGSFTGAPREWHSSVLSILIDEIYTPTFRLATTDEPGLLPPQVQKYIRYYVLSRCFGRQGEGYRPDLAQHYYYRFELGVKKFQRLHDVCYRDRDFSRVPTGLTSGRPQRVRFPATFPQVLV